MSTVTKKIIKTENGEGVKYVQKFCDKWLTIFDPWLARASDDENKPFCRACQCRLDCNRCHLQRHERTRKHVRNLAILISRGEVAAQQNFSIRQERSKYYQQRMKLSAADNVEYPDDDITQEIAEQVAEENVGTNFQFVETDACISSDTHVLKQEDIDNNDTLNTSQQQNTNSASNKGTQARKSGSVIKRPAASPATKKERMKLLMQIQKDKHDLMDSFKELMGVSPPPARNLRNHIDLFFDSVSSSVKALTPKLIAEAKMRVSQLICELELRALTEKEGNTSMTVPAVATTVMLEPQPAVDSTQIQKTFIINQNLPANLAHHGMPHN